MTPQESREARAAVELEIVPEAKTAVVKLRGEHDLSTKPRISEALVAAVEQAPHVLVDLAECTFVDSSLVTVLVEARAELDGGITLGVVIPPHATAARRLAQVTRLEDVVPIYETRVAAIERRPVPPPEHTKRINTHD